MHKGELRKEKENKGRERKHWTGRALLYLPGHDAADVSEEDGDLLARGPREREGEQGASFRSP